MHKNSSNRLIYLLTNTRSLTEDLREKFELPKTPEYSAHIEELTKKRNLVESEFFRTPAMTSNKWKEAGNKFRHRTTRGAIHGFHHVICHVGTYHEPDKTCICKLCNEHCEKLHLYKCRNKESFEWKSCEARG